MVFEKVVLDGADEQAAGGLLCRATYSGAEKEHIAIATHRASKDAAGSIHRRATGMVIEIPGPIDFVGMAADQMNAFLGCKSEADDQQDG